MSKDERSSVTLGMMHHITVFRDSATADFLEWLRVYRPDITSIESLGADEYTRLYLEYKVSSADTGKPEK
jgi:hypothetical protein